MAEAANVSRKELEQVEQQVKAQNLEHQRLQEQASKISRELKDVNQQMIKSAKMIQNSEESLSKMEAELEQLTNDLQQAQTNFSSQDENLIKTLSALQNLALRIPFCATVESGGNHPQRDVAAGNGAVFGGKRFPAAERAGKNRTAEKAG